MTLLHISVSEALYLDRVELVMTNFTVVGAGSKLRATFHNRCIKHDWTMVCCGVVSPADVSVSETSVVQYTV